MIKLGYWVWFVYYLLRTYILLVSETSEFCFAKNGSDIFIELCLFYFLIITNEQLSVADTDGDEKVNVRDATLIQKYLANIVTSLG